jgi:putative hydrolase of the HAD superfamily
VTDAPSPDHVPSTDSNHPTDDDRTIGDDHPVDAVCFDLDGTLCHSALSDAEKNRAVFDRVGRDPLFTPADLRAVDVDDLPEAGSLAGFYANLYRETARRVDADVDPDSPLFDDLGEAAAAVSDEAGVQFRDGAREALERARDRYSVGLVTNGRVDRQTAKLESLGIDDAFDATVICDPNRGNAGKPGREPFETVLSTLGVAAESTLFVGDTHAWDVVGPHRVGMQSAWVPRNLPHETVPDDPDPEPTYRLASMRELTEII